jgi:hypothetical protein
MQDKTSQVKTETIALTDWEFRLDGTFVEKQMPELRHGDPNGDWNKTLQCEGWTNTIALSSDAQVVEVKVFRKERTPEFLIDLWDCDRGLGLIYCRNLPTLLEFFRKYESFLSLGRKQEWNEAISNVNRYLFDRRDGIAAVRRIEAREEEAEYRRRYVRQAQAE